MLSGLLALLSCLVVQNLMSYSGSKPEIFGIHRGIMKKIVGLIFVAHLVAAPMQCMERLVSQLDLSSLQPCVMSSGEVFQAVESIISQLDRQRLNDNVLILYNRLCAIHKNRAYRSLDFETCLIGLQQAVEGKTSALESLLVALRPLNSPRIGFRVQRPGHDLVEDVRVLRKNIKAAQQVSFSNSGLVEETIATVTWLVALYPNQTNELQKALNELKITAVSNSKSERARECMCLVGHHLSTEQLKGLSSIFGD